MSELERLGARVVPDERLKEGELLLRSDTEMIRQFADGRLVRLSVRPGEIVPEEVRTFVSRRSAVLGPVGFSSMPSEERNQIEAEFASGQRVGQVTFYFTLERVLTVLALCQEIDGVRDSVGVEECAAMWGIGTDRAATELKEAWQHGVLERVSLAGDQYRYTATPKGDLLVGPLPTEETHEIEEPDQRALPPARTDG